MSKYKRSHPLFNTRSVLIVFAMVVVISVGSRRYFSTWSFVGGDGYGSSQSSVPYYDYSAGGESSQSVYFYYDVSSDGDILSTSASSSNASQTYVNEAALPCYDMLENSSPPDGIDGSDPACVSMIENTPNAYGDVGSCFDNADNDYDQSADSEDTDCAGMEHNQQGATY